MIHMSANLTEQRHHAHAYLDRLPGDQLATVHDLLESMLSPLDRKLALIPIDDEPVTAEEAAAIDAGINSLNRNGCRAWGASRSLDVKESQSHSWSKVYVGERRWRFPGCSHQQRDETGGAACGVNLFEIVNGRLKIFP
jgi:hypothetical protein